MNLLNQNQSSTEKDFKFFYLALLVGVVFNGCLSFYTLESTYDALIHVFFAHHYYESWWEPWQSKWYTGFCVFSYPPLVHQLLALFSSVLGLKGALYFYVLFVVSIFVSGVYSFSYLITSNRAVAGVSAMVAVMSGAFLETLHIFGQLPTLTGISFLLLSLKPVYQYIRFKKIIYLIKALTLLAATTTSHHVTPIFGLVFFILPIKRIFA